MKEINPTNDKISKETTDKPERRLDTFDGITESSDSHKQADTFDDIARQGHSSDSIRTFDDIGGYDKHHDRKITEQMLKEGANREISERFGDSIPDAKRDLMLADRVEYQDDREFKEEFLKKNPGDVEQTLGYCDKAEEKIYINRDVKDKYEITVHEELHLSEDEKASSLLGEKLNEGITQHFTKQIDQIELVGDAKCYPEEQEIVNMISARTSDIPLQEAYFKGDISSLQKELDRQLGEGAFDEIRYRMDQGDYKKVKDIIRGGM